MESILMAIICMTIIGTYSTPKNHITLSLTNETKEFLTNLLHGEPNKKSKIV